MRFAIAVLPGDGIGPEVAQEAVKALEHIGERYGHTFDLSYASVGGKAIDRYGTALPDEALQTARKADAVFFGAVGGPQWDDPRASVRPEDAILGLRRHLGLFANLRPVKVYPDLVHASPLRPEVLDNADLVVIRELTGGLYFGKPKRRWSTSRGRRGVDTMKYTEQEIRRILQVGFELAQGRRHHLTSVDKANVLETSRLWRQVALEVAKEYPEVTLEHMLVDTAAMRLVSNPSRFDVIVTENLFGDILTDEAAVLTGSMGMLPSASLAGVPRVGKVGQRTKGLYEPIHGSAPDIAGQGKANPIAAILSAAFLLRYSLGLEQEALALEEAVDNALAQGCRTPDIAEEAKAVLTTQEMGAAIREGIG